MIVLQNNKQRQQRRGSLCLNREVGQAVILKIGDETIRVVIGKKTQINGMTGRAVVQLVIQAPHSVDISREDVAGVDQSSTQEGK